MFEFLCNSVDSVVYRTPTRKYSICPLSLRACLWHVISTNYLFFHLESELASHYIGGEGTVL